MTKIRARIAAFCCLAVVFMTPVTGSAQAGQCDGNVDTLMRLVDNGEGAEALELLKQSEPCLASDADAAAEWLDTADRLAEKFEEARNLEVAREARRLTVLLAETGYGEVSLQAAQQLRKTSLLCLVQEDFDAAEAAATRSIEVFDSLEEKTPEIGQALNTLAETYRRSQRLDEAEPLYLRAAEILERAGGDWKLQLSSVLNNLANYSFERQQFDVAEQYYMQSLELAVELFSEESDEAAYPMDGLGNLFSVSGQMDKAEVWLKKAVAIREKIGSERLSTSQQTLATFYRRLGDFPEATRYYEMAIETHRTSVGDEDVALGAIYFNYAEMSWAAGKFADAESLLNEALRILKAILPADHNHIFTGYSFLGVLAVNQGKYGEALPHLELAIAGYERTVGPDHRLTGRALNNLGELYRELGQYDKAIETSTRVNEIFMKLYGEGHQASATARNNLARMYADQGDWEQAGPGYAEALAMMIAVNGERHPDVASVRNNLALAWLELGKYAEAQAGFEQSLEVLESLA